MNHAPSEVGNTNTSQLLSAIAARSAPAPGLYKSYRSSSQDSVPSHVPTPIKMGCVDKIVQHLPARITRLQDSTVIAWQAHQSADGTLMRSSMVVVRTMSDPRGPTGSEEFVPLSLEWPFMVWLMPP